MTEVTYSSSSSGHNTQNEGYIPEQKRWVLQVQLYPLQKHTLEF